MRNKQRRNEAKVERSMIINMKLSNEGLMKDRENYLAKDYQLPSYDRQAVALKTLKNPSWIHFGTGNIFRAFPAAVLEDLLNEGAYDTGLIAVEGFDHELIEKAYLPYDNLSLLVVLKADGAIEKKVIGSVTHSLAVDKTEDPSFKELASFFCNPSLQMVSFTITEKGYSLKGADGELSPLVKQDFAMDSMNPVHIMGKTALLLYQRYLSGGHPIAMVSMDNCSHNGDKLKESVLAYAAAWTGKKLINPSFLSWLSDPCKVSFPLSMIDKITPRPDSTVKELLEKDGFEDTELIITDKNTYTAPFVNAEETQYLVIEDSFPGGRPPLDQKGVYFTSRETVDKVEKMKVCTCLNPLHTALAIFGCLLDYHTIWEEMKDPALKELITRMGYEEGMPVVVDPGIIEPGKFIDEVLTKRLPNPFIPDTPQRIATDTSQKLPIRFGETLKAYLYVGKDVESLKWIPLVLAGYLRYLMGVDDKGNAFEPSSDPLLESLRNSLSHVKMGQTVAVSDLNDIFSMEDLFGLDLTKTGLPGLITKYFNSMLSGPGSVRKTLEDSLA